MRIKGSAFLVAGLIQFIVGILLFLFAILVTANAFAAAPAIEGFMGVMAAVNIFVPTIAYLVTRNRR